MPLKGYKQTAEHRAKLSAYRKGVYTDEKHPRWKGEKVGYRGLHKWIERKLGTPRECEKCNVIEPRQHRMHWANISGKYLRDIADWMRLCAKCHGAYDTAKRKQSCT